MGLDTSHNVWHGAYSSFRRFRAKIAEVSGWELNAEGDADLPFDRLTQENFDGEWTEQPSDPLLPFFAHSDCDGVWHPAQAGPIADRLEELLSLLPEGSGGGHIGDWRDAAQQVIVGLRDAVSRGEDVDFH